ncbi:hypothetical protein GN956_G12863 [Arapaima gigas]
MNVRVGRTVWTDDSTAPSEVDSLVLSNIVTDEWGNVDGMKPQVPPVKEEEPEDRHGACDRAGEMNLGTTHLAVDYERRVSTANRCDVAGPQGITCNFWDNSGLEAVHKVELEMGSKTQGNQGTWPMTVSLP